MGVFRVNKTKDFTVMARYHFKEKNMSLKAKGLLSLMLSLPDNWDYSIAGLVTLSKDNETSVKSAVAELKQFGYIRIDKLKPTKGNNRIDYVYNVYEKPMNASNSQEGGSLGVETLGVETLGVETLGVENHGQYNNNNKIINNKKLNNIYNSKDRVAKIPEWFDKKIEKKEPNETEKLEMENLLKDYN